MYILYIKKYSHLILNIFFQSLLEFFDKFSLLLEHLQEHNDYLIKFPHLNT